MFKLKISNLTSAKRLSQEWATHTISLIDPDIDDITLPIAGKESLLRRYYFHDVNPKYTPSEYLKPATPEQIQEILEFSAWLEPTDKLLVHCHAGISRSTAVAIGILCQHGLTPKKAFTHVLQIRPLASPNRHILALFDDILKLEGKLVAAYPQVFARSMFLMLLRCLQRPAGSPRRSETQGKL
jgi:predicted protein tyrosine phosphatase